MSSGRIQQIPSAMSEFHGIPMESGWLEPQPFQFPIPLKFQQSKTNRDMIENVKYYPKE